MDQADHSGDGFRPDCGDETVTVEPGVDLELWNVRFAVEHAEAIRRLSIVDTERLELIGPSWFREPGLTEQVPYLRVAVEASVPPGRALHVVSAAPAPAFTSAAMPTELELANALGTVHVLLGPAAQAKARLLWPRPQVGRPSMSDAGASPRRSIRLPSSLDERLVRRADDAGLTVSEAIREAIMAYVERDSEARP